MQRLVEQGEYAESEQGFVRADATPDEATFLDNWTALQREHRENALNDPDERLTSPGDALAAHLAGVEPVLVEKASREGAEEERESLDYEQVRSRRRKGARTMIGEGAACRSQSWHAAPKPRMPPWPTRSTDTARAGSGRVPDCAARERHHRERPQRAAWRGRAARPRRGRHR